MNYITLLFHRSAPGPAYLHQAKKLVCLKDWSKAIVYIQSG